MVMIIMVGNRKEWERNGIEQRRMEQRGKWMGTKEERGGERQWSNRNRDWPSIFHILRIIEFHYSPGRRMRISKSATGCPPFTSMAVGSSTFQISTAYNFHGIIIQLPRRKASTNSYGPQIIDVLRVNVAYRLNHVDGFFVCFILPVYNIPELSTSKLSFF